jgi:D-alanine-D-alanine ligase-like ATP-grasp enzyme
MSDIVDRLREAAYSGALDILIAHRFLAEAADEIERLQSALKTANDQTEHFEREWYLRGDDIEQLRAERDALKADAERWREVRRRGAAVYGMEYRWLSEDDIDAAIDKTMGNKT